MIELRTLGAVDLRRSSGEELRPLLQQPKRLALLAYLGLAKPGTLHRRDSLLALFWPDLDQDHARAALRRALYFLRQTAGADLITSRGDEEVGVDPTHFWCDLLAFDEAVANHQLEAAMELYRGHFLEGFYVAGAPEAEAWFDRERAVRRESAARTAWQLAERTIHEVATSLRWARRALDYHPDDEQPLRTFLHQLAGHGHRSSAVRLYDEFSHRLLAELGVEPSSETVRFAARLRESNGENGRARAEPATTVAASQARSTPTPALILVCPFSVRGAASLSYLRDGMVDLLRTKLDVTGKYRTVDPRPALAGTGELDGPATARLAVAAGADSFIRGSVIESGGRIEVGLGLFGADGTLRTRVEARAEHESGLFDLVDELVRNLVAETSDTAAERLTRLAALTTSSLAALKAYLTGEREFRLGRHLQALDAFRRATAEDRSFALAYYRLASSLAASALIEPARRASAEAFRHRERLSEHDRMLLEAQHAWLRGATADAERRYGALTTLYPNQLEGWFLLGDLLFHSNPYRGRSITEARGAFQRTLALDPDHLSALIQLARLAALEERLDELAALADRALTLSPSADQALGIRALRAFALGYTAEQQDLVTELHRAPGLTIARAFADVAVYTRNWDGAESLGRSLLPAARSEEFQAVGHIILAHLALARGRRAEAFDLLRHAGRHQPAWSLEIRGLFATLPFGPADAGEWTALERELREWDPSTVPPSASAPLAFHDGLHAHFRGYLLGLLRARQGDPNGVALEAEALAELPLPPGNEVLTEHLIRTLDAEALRLQGRPADALAALERLRTDVWFQLAVGSPFFAGTYQRFLRAELLAEAGRADEALGWWQTIAQRSPYELIFLAAAEQRMAKLLAGRGRTEQARRHEAAARSLLHSVPSERTT